MNMVTKGLELSHLRILAHKCVPTLLSLSLLIHCQNCPGRYRTEWYYIHKEKLALIFFGFFSLSIIAGYEKDRLKIFHERPVSNLVSNFSSVICN